MNDTEKAKAYDELLVRLQKAKVDNDVCDERYCCVIDDIVPELKEGEDEKIRKSLVAYFAKFKQSDMWDADFSFGDIIAWLEKQGEKEKFIKKELDCIRGYRDEAIRRLNEIEKQGEQKPADKVEHKFKVGDEIKTANEESLTITKIDEKGYWSEDLFICSFEDSVKWELVGKLIDKVEPKFKVKYADSEYNVLEVKDIAGVTFYGIEDEPNHIDYVKADNCEIVGGYGIKENGSPYPTKPAVFSEQKPVWSEEDDRMIITTTHHLERQKNYQLNSTNIEQCQDWLKSLKDRVQPQPKHEWSEEDETALNNLIYALANDRIGNNRDEYVDWLKSVKPQNGCKPSDEHYELEEFAKIVRSNLTGISKAVQKLFEAKYLQLTGNKMYGGFKD